MLLSTAIAIASIPLYLALAHSGGIDGLAVASLIGMTISAVATLLWAYWLHGAPALSNLMDTAGRALLLSVPAAFVVRWIAGTTPASMSAAVVNLCLGGALFAALVAAGIALVGDDALRGLLKRTTGRFARR